MRVEGGASALYLMQRELIEKRRWLTRRARSSASASTSDRVHPGLLVLSGAAIGIVIVALGA